MVAGWVKGAIGMVKLSAKASGVSLHFEKHKGTVEINGLQRHNERRPGGRHKNQRIDDSRTHENVILTQAGGTYYQRIQEIIASGREGGLKGVRKDAVRMVEATVQLSGQILDRPEAEQEAVLRDAFGWLEETFGRENVVSAAIHKDETNMHLHVDFVPIDAERKLNAKKLISQPALKIYQSDFLKHLQKGYPWLNFRRGASGRPYGLSQKAYEWLQDQRKEMEQELEEWEDELFNQEAALSDQEAALSGREAVIAAKEAELAARLKKLTAEEKKRLKTANTKAQGILREAESKAAEIVKAAEINFTAAKQSYELEFEKLRAERGVLAAEKERIEELGKLMDEKELKLKSIADTANEALKKAKTPIKRARLNKAVAKVPELTPDISLNDLTLTEDMLKGLGDEELSL